MGKIRGVYFYLFGYMHSGTVLEFSSFVEEFLPKNFFPNKVEKSYGYNILGYLHLMDNFVNDILSKDSK